MGSPPALCLSCGLRFPALGFNIVNATGITFNDCGTNCPRCGGEAKIVDGTYDFVGNVISAFSAPGVSRQSVVALQGIAEAVKAGRTSQAEASSQISQLGNSLVGVWGMLNDNSGALSVLLAIIALYLAMNNYEHGNEKLEAILLRQTQIVETIEAELRRKSLTIPNQQPSTPTNHLWGQQAEPQRQADVRSMNRHERRKAHAKMRKHRI